MYSFGERTEDISVVHGHLIDSFIRSCILVHISTERVKRAFPDDSMRCLYKILLRLPNCSKNFIGKNIGKVSKNAIGKCFYDTDISPSSEELSNDILKHKIMDLQKFIESRLSSFKEDDIWDTYIHCFTSQTEAVGGQALRKSKEIVDEETESSEFFHRYFLIANILLGFITNNKILVPSKVRLSYDSFPEEFKFLKYIGHKLKPDFLLCQENNPLVIGEFKVSKNKGPVFKCRSLLKQVLTYLLSGKLSNFFITKGDAVVIYYLQEDATVKNIQQRSDKPFKFEVELGYAKVPTFQQISKAIGRNIKLRLTTLLLISILAVENYEMSTTKSGKDVVKDVLMKVKKSDRETQHIIDSTRTQYQIHHLHNAISERHLLANLPQNPRKTLDIKTNFRYRVISELPRTIVLVTNFAQLKVNIPNLSNYQFPDSKKFVLKIYDYIRLRNALSEESKFDRMMLGDDAKTYIQIIFEDQFINEIMCQEKIEQHNSCSEDAINSPKLYFYGYIDTTEFCGFYLGMEELDFINEKPTCENQINQGILELEKLYSIGIIHNDVRLSNVCYDTLNQKFWILDFGVSILFEPNNEDEETCSEEDMEDMKTLLDE